ALFVDPDSPEMLKAAIDRLIEDEPLRRRLADHAYDRGRQFTVERCAAGYLDAYAELTRSDVPETTLAGKFLLA
ncbi:MAG TPA: hypothetical protein VGE01_07705, partial [Fimbriimonas sp.]